MLKRTSPEAASTVVGTICCGHCGGTDTCYRAGGSCYPISAYSIGHWLVDDAGSGDYISKQGHIECDTCGESSKVPRKKTIIFLSPEEADQMGEFDCYAAAGGW